MKLSTIISEFSFFTYSGMVQIVFKDISSSKVAELIRALPGVTTVTIAGSDEQSSKVTLKIKLISQKSGIQAFQAMKANALKKYSPIKVVSIGEQTIEKK